MCISWLVAQEILWCAVLVVCASDEASKWMERLSRDALLEFLQRHIIIATRSIFYISPPSRDLHHRLQTGWLVDNPVSLHPSGHCSNRKNHRLLSAAAGLASSSSRNTYLCIRACMGMLIDLSMYLLILIWVAGRERFQ